jgi:hypothetical protein
MGRILKESATVPLFFGQTMIQSLREVGLGQLDGSAYHVHACLRGVVHNRLSGRAAPQVSRSR